MIDLTFSGFDVADGFLNNSGSANAVGNMLISPYVWAYSFQPIWPQVGGSTNASDNPFSSGANDTSSVMVTFAPSGAIDSVWCWYFPNLPNYPKVGSGSNPVPLPVKPTTPVHLLVGRREVLPTAGTPPANINPNASGFQTYLNWQDLGNFWVSINQQTGLVTTVENNASSTAIANGAYGNGGYGSLVELFESRQLVVESQRMGGR